MNARNSQATGPGLIPVGHSLSLLLLISYLLCVAFVAPGPEVGGRLGLDVEAAGMSVASTPRDAGVLPLVGDFAGRLAESAAVVYAQMMRPRVTA